MRRKLKLILLLPAAAALALSLVALWPFRRVRLGQLASARIGPFVTGVEAYLCRNVAGLNGEQRSCDLFYFQDYVCNSEVARQWRARLRVIPFSNVAYVAARLLARFKTLAFRHLIPPEEMSWFGLAAERAIHKYRGHLAISADFAHTADKLVARMTRGRPFVCLHVRDSTYLRRTQPRADYSYHDYRDWLADSLLPAIRELTDRGYCLVRMGAAVDGAFPLAGENILDYALSEHRSDEMDLYLASRCAFWLGAASGLADVSMAFRRPQLFVNFVSPLIPGEPRITVFEHSLWIFKKYWSRARGRLMTFREILDTGAGGLYRSEEFSAAGIELIDNSPQEIRDATLEMLGRLNGTWKESAEDCALQGRFWSLWGEAARQHAAQARVLIGARFLSANPELLN